MTTFLTYDAVFNLEKTNWAKSYSLQSPRHSLALLIPYENHWGTGAALVSELGNGLQDFNSRRCSDAQWCVKLHTIWYHFTKLLPRKFVKALNAWENLQEQSDLTSQPGRQLLWDTPGSWICAAKTLLGEGMAKRNPARLKTKSTWGLGCQYIEVGGLGLWKTSSCLLFQLFQLFQK